jgi:hypothetical protein
MISTSKSPLFYFSLFFQNVKAYLRRGIAREAVLNHQEALQGVTIFYLDITFY